jgi:hypothetical protein
MTVESRLGRGSRFSFTLPRAAKSEQTTLPQAPGSHAQQSPLSRAAGESLGEGG